MHTFTFLFFLLLTVEYFVYCQQPADMVALTLQTMMEKQESLLEEMKEIHTRLDHLEDLHREAKESCFQKSDFQRLKALGFISNGDSVRNCVAEYHDYPDILDGPWRNNVFDSSNNISELAIDIPSNIHFLLWTRSNKPDYAYNELVLNDDNSVTNSHFDGTKPTIFLAHGWISKGTTTWIHEAKTEFLKWKDCNFIAIDWENIASNIYSIVAYKVPEVAQHAAQFLDFLHEKHNLNVNEVYLAGHSLGAHLVGIMGLNVKTHPLPRITGLDPAGPGFIYAPNDKRMDKTDAIFVDVIHTNAEQLGLSESIGHVDFFPNGGTFQPGCSILYSPCSHSRAFEYWIESVNGEVPLNSVPCPDLKSYNEGKCVSNDKDSLDMGVHVARHLQGNFYLGTNNESPFAKG